MFEGLVQNASTDGINNYRDITKPYYESDGTNYLSVGSNSLVDDSTQDAVTKLAKDLNIKLSDDTKDYLYQYMLQSKRDSWAWQRTMEADNTKYQRAVADLQAAGLNPFLAFQSINGSSANANGGSISSGSIASQKNAKTQQSTNIAQAIFSMLGTIAFAVIMAMA